MTAQRERETKKNLQQRFHIYLVFPTKPKFMILIIVNLYNSFYMYGGRHSDARDFRITSDNLSCSLNLIGGVYIDWPPRKQRASVVRFSRNTANKYIKTVSRRMNHSVHRNTRWISRRRRLEWFAIDSIYSQRLSIRAKSRCDWRGNIATLEALYQSSVIERFIRSWQLFDSPAWSVSWISSAANFFFISEVSKQSSIDILIFILIYMRNRR